MIYDCFIFNNEVELLELRLNILDPHGQVCLDRRRYYILRLPKEVFIFKIKNALQSGKIRSFITS